MAKLITRMRERNLMKRRGEAAYEPWGEWELCEGTEGLEARDLKRMAADEWHLDDERVITGSGEGWQLEARTPYSREQYRVVPDGFDVADYNKRLKE